ncbi:hypothetical protein [Lactobacillus bombicola]|uniref:hypothetical protein n=1 Tax=Lactobacillus bombicola TaxID=1505723 RepID=UPI0013563BF5
MKQLITVNNSPTRQITEIFNRLKIKGKVTTKILHQITGIGLYWFILRIKDICLNLSINLIIPYLI